MSFPILKAPFPWFGGKSRVAAQVWERFGDVVNYVEPFAGSLAVLLGRPTPPRTETVNDLDAYLANFWRATSVDPEAVAEAADWPVNEADLHARHLWLVNQVEFRERMKTDPDFYDAKIAGWWVWGLCQWIGSGWCSRPEWTGRTNAGRADRGILAGAHNVPRLGAEALHRPNMEGLGINRKRPMIPNLGDQGRGVNVKRPMLSGNGHGAGIQSDRVTRQLPHVNHDRRIECGDRANYLLAYFLELRARLRRVRVCCGDWKRVTGPSVTEKHGASGIFLDPPYDMRVVSDGSGLYAHHDNDLAGEVRAWAIENGDNPLLRIALCGYEEEHGSQMPESWECFHWKATGGYGSQAADGNDNAARERIWFSPHCLRPQKTFQFEEALPL